LREDKGYTYGVYSRFARPNDTGTFRVQGDFNQANTGDSVTEILKELARIRTEPISDEELANAKNKIIGNFSVSLEDPGNFANQLATRALTGIPIDELNNYIPSIEAITTEQAQSAAQKYINADSPIIVVVGDPKVVKPQLEKIKPVQEVDSNGKPVSK
jgi:predicted Zn-dependent peptidase